MTDCELLEQAAKAAGIVLDWSKGYSCRAETIVCADAIIHDIYNDLIPWNPLENDGDALRLAVELGICIAPGCNTLTHGSKYAVATGDNGEVLEERRADPYTATRRAIVRAAAEIGKDTE